MNTHRVGSLTFGSVLIAVGILMIINVFLPVFASKWMAIIWPLILIALGIEILFANIRSNKVKFIYDIPAIFLMALLVIFSMCMAWVQVSMEYWQICRF